MLAAVRLILAVGLLCSALPGFNGHAIAQPKPSDSFPLIEAWKQDIVRHLVQRTKRARRDIIRAYDPAAGRQHFEVMLTFSATGSGRILSAAIEMPSGSPTFDAIALRILQHAGQMPRLPKNFADRKFSFQLPMKFDTGPGPHIAVKSTPRI